MKTLHFHSRWESHDARPVSGATNSANFYNFPDCSGLLQRHMATIAVFPWASQNVTAEILVVTWNITSTDRYGDETSLEI
jgi:hypothetical protein